MNVSFVSDASGPPPDVADPLRGIRLAFACGPSYVKLRRVDAALLVPTAPIHDDPRNGGSPPYFSDVVVRDDRPTTGLADLVSAPVTDDDYPESLD